MVYWSQASWIQVLSFLGRQSDDERYVCKVCGHELCPAKIKALADELGADVREVAGLQEAYRRGWSRICAHYQEEHPLQWDIIKADVLKTLGIRHEDQLYD